MSQPRLLPTVQGGSKPPRSWIWLRRHFLSERQSLVMERSDIELQRLVRLFVQSSYSEDIEAFFFVAKGVLGLDRGEVRERLQRIFEANDQALPQAGRPENDEN